MNYFQKSSKNYYIYIVLIFVFIPLNFIPQLFDAVMIDYAYEIEEGLDDELMEHFDDKSNY